MRFILYKGCTYKPPPGPFSQNRYVFSIQQKVLRYLAVRMQLPPGCCCNKTHHALVRAASQYQKKTFRERKGWVVGPKLSGICRLANMRLMPSRDRMSFLTWHSQRIMNIAVLLRSINTTEPMLLGTNRGPDGLPCVPCSQNSKLPPNTAPLRRVRRQQCLLRGFTALRQRGGSWRITLKVEV